MNSHLDFNCIIVFALHIIGRIEVGGGGGGGVILGLVDMRSAWPESDLVKLKPSGEFLYTFRDKAPLKLVHSVSESITHFVMAFCHCFQCRGINN